MPAITYGDTYIRYHLHREKDIPFIKIYLDDLNGICVTASEKKEDARIEAFVQKKAAWIEEKWQKTHPSLYKVDQLNLESEQKISYLGRSYRLFIEPSDAVREASFAFQKGKFYFTYPSKQEESAVQELIILTKNWLQQKAEDKLPDLSEEQPVYIEKDCTRLGVKEEDGFYLNWRLVQQSKAKTQQTLKDLEEGNVY
ncbi:YgjP-like metallopeptidase domain-containing protein [Halobacillus litoralis]|uniref:YgjP-like metallopeptidase domain-containing protein n=1 Tax=Halobacillus litoralis TaxID=45668 RepID=UPI001CFD8AC6|nr:YgjP-like metallopeptidase domain-containing protein [Halobacillus litoralis]